MLTRVGHRLAQALLRGNRTRKIHQCPGRAEGPARSIAAVSARRMRGPRETGCMKGVVRMTSSSRWRKAALRADQQTRRTRQLSGGRQGQPRAPSPRTASRSGGHRCQAVRPGCTVGMQGGDGQALALLGGFGGDGASGDRRSAEPRWCGRRAPGAGRRYAELGGLLHHQVGGVPLQGREGQPDIGLGRLRASCGAPMANTSRSLYAASAMVAANARRRGR